MRLNPLGAFKDPRKRPRIIIWMGVALIGFVLMWAGGLVGTSTRWFCETPCHIVHDDNTLAYNASTHSKITCIACHEPVNASPITYTLMKVHVLPDLPATIFKYFKLPMNERDSVAIDMPTKQCTQCHNLNNRTVTPSNGILINHKVHTDQGINCTTCHNRVAHPEENIKLILKGDKKHENWMTMDACFRCHGTQQYAKAPTECSACHTPKFDLVPSTHKQAGWYTAYGNSKGHAEAAIEESRSVAEAVKAEGEGEAPDAKKAQGPILHSAGTVNSCYTCHKRKFCDDCHGTQIPHDASFKKQHSKLGYANPVLCSKCHAASPQLAKDKYGACESCHHKGLKPGTPWIQQHPGIVKANGSQTCLKCHDERQCSACHVRVSSPQQ